MRRTAFILAFLLLTAPCGAKTITVDDDGPADYNNIQAAIDDSNDGDIIEVQPGLYGLYEESIHFLGKNITLTSTNPHDFNIVAATTINGGVRFSGSEDPNCMLIGFNIDRTIGIGPPLDSNGIPDPNYESQNTHASISYCVLQGNIVDGGTVISRCDGTIKNCLIADNVHDPNSLCITPAIDGCNGLIKNCTIANNYSAEGVGVELGGTLTIQNCLIYGNNWWHQIIIAPEAVVNISYSDIQNGLSGIIGSEFVNWGPGNIDIDPCFVREGYGDFNEPWTLFEGDYHLQSAAGRWDPNSESWVIDANTSDCIDAGNPGCPVGSEPMPNGNRINMGAYGGTPTASKSPADWRSIADLTNDWVVDFNDLAVFVDYWLDVGECVPSDLNRSESVNFADYAIFADNWRVE